MLHLIALDALRRLALISLLLIVSTTSWAETKTYTITAPDGVTIAVQESGAPDGQPVILIHGLLGSHLSWEAQVRSPALQGYRLITYDLRGHGVSGMPSSPEAYTDGRRWADDLAAVIAASNAHNPVLVGWSLGAAVITNYLAAYGDGRIAGALYVGGVIELQPDQIVAHPAVYHGLSSADLRTHLDAEREFLALCFQTQPDTVTFQRLLANAALASPTMQDAVPSMTIAVAEGLGATRKPMLLLYGTQDALVHPEPSIARAKALNSNIRSIMYSQSGHAPFLEEADRFNRDLSAFVDEVTQP
ncbi:alpha/beta fold hydrolase [Halomonas binhaiensis]|uniref:Alpha/beta hydrolase n=1 Tax=Halomonas binhaiensis TaxID=2562282 RepID=A0A5C1NKV4_9GAMM|nr:alpha/beta hydrolase [Halomonas binhaiensis]QEM83027.1 alpha/beta hydrolase [Halomonas binhaiensis]